MNWNPYKRIAELEKDHAAATKTIEKLTDFSILLRGRIEVLERTQNIHEHNLKDLNNRVQRSEGIAVEQNNQLCAVNAKFVNLKDDPELVNKINIMGKVQLNQTRQFEALEARLKETHPNTVATMTMGEFKKAKTREYARARYAKIKAEKLGGVK